MHISTGGVITCVIPVLVYSHGHPYHVLSEYGATMANHELPSTLGGLLQSCRSYLVTSTACLGVDLGYIGLPQLSLKGVL